jgi:hypothetical protein
MKRGDITPSGNFMLTTKIKSLNTLYKHLMNEKSIFARHRMYPTAFIYSWQIRQCDSWIKRGWFWKTKKVTNK